MTTSKQLIEDLKKKIRDTIGATMPTDKKFALLDFPDYGNVGDSAIWLGEITYFKEIFKAKPVYVCHKDNYSWEELEVALPQGTIFFHGGGNFGDLWASHQEFREKTIERFHHYPIVQLPQSIHFSNPDALARAAKIINAHPNYTIFVRDEKSFGIARETFNCKVLLCPDSAFYMGAIEKPIQPSFDLLILLRTDHETTGAALPQKLPPNTKIADWLDDDATMKSDMKKKTILQLPCLGFDALNKHMRREKFYRNLSQARVDRGLKLLSSGKYIITDRLHTHILSLLLNIPHTILDNNYGKISSFAKLWTHSADIVKTAQTIDEALANR